MVYNYDSEEFRNSSIYKNFININNGNGILKIEASTANGAYPLSGVLITISKRFGEDTVIFYSGVTNDSGIIESIVLPTRKPAKEVEEASDIVFTTYDLEAKDPKYNVQKMYDVSIFDEIKVIQPVTFPVSELIEGDGNN